MAFAPSFGSFGDFLSIAILIKDVVVALGDCRGSSSKYLELRQGLEILGETVHQVDQACNNPKLVVSNDISTAARRIISQIRQCLTAFNSHKLQKYATSLAPGGSGNLLKDVARKIQYKFDEKDIENFQREILGYNMLLTTLMEVSTMHTIERNNDDTAKRISALASQNQELQKESGRNSRFLVNFGKKVFARLNILSHLAKDIQNSTTQVLSLVFTISTGVAELRSMIMKIEWPLRDEHFVLEDATGRAFPIPLKTVTSWAMFEYILQEHFKGRTGAHRVLRRRYMLSERATSIEVERTTTWEIAFRPYQRVDMSIMCKAPETETDVDKLCTCPFCGKESTSELDAHVKCQNCNMFYKRIVDLEEDEENSMAAPIAPQQQRIPQFGKPAFSPGLPHRLRNKRQRDQVSESEKGDTCNKCHGPKRSKHQGNNKRKAVGEDDSESDEENYRGLSRVTLVSRRKRARTAQDAFAGFWATDMNGTSFAGLAQNISPGLGAQSQIVQDNTLFSSRPDGGWKWPEKATGVTSTLSDSDSDSSGNILGDPGVISSKHSEQSRGSSVEKDIGEASDSHKSLPRNEEPRETNNAIHYQQKGAPPASSKFELSDYESDTPEPSTAEHVRGPSKYSYPPSFSPRYDSTTGSYWISLPPRPRRLLTRDNHQSKHVEDNDGTSPDTKGSKLGKDRQRLYSYRSEDEDEYVEVDDVIYVIPAKSRSRRRNKSENKSPGESYIYGTPYYYEEPRRPHRPQRTRAPEKAPSTSKKATEEDAKKHRIPAGYSLKNWDSGEEPILILGSVFDANSLGKWIYDWTVFAHGPTTPVSEMAGDLWLLLIQLAGKIKRSKESSPRIQPLDDQEMFEDFIESGERLFDKLQKLLKVCEKPMLAASKKKPPESGSKTGVLFVETIFGRERELEKTEKLMQSIRLWNMRFDANCVEILDKLKR
ncbi:hypothetical protein Daus18300_003410 [Diaporthe australafricana]|uniref:Ubiquitin-like domain-containing protein n=1 Tax=Diaporthe australafricana TaxID=127596 RepID=A0ABR3XG00_9PEZI